MRFSSYAATVIVAALFFTAQPARAQLSVTIDGLTFSTPNGTTETFAFSAGANGFQKVTGNATYDSTVGLTLSITTLGTSSTPLTYAASYDVITAGPYTLETSSSVTTPASLYPNIAGSILVDGTASGSIVNSKTINMTGPFSDTFTQVTAPTSIGASGSYSTPFASGSKGATFIVTTQITPLTTVPEPTGVLMGLLGLPCLGAVVFFARRRSSAMAAMVA